VNSINLYVGNLEPSVTEDELRALFLQFGQVTRVLVKNDHRRGDVHSTSSGYVEMPSVKDGNAAIDGLNGRALRGQVLSVIEAMPMSPGRVPEKRRRGVRGRTVNYRR
jgi:RNA recognition motif-containing protein